MMKKLFIFHFYCSYVFFSMFIFLYAAVWNQWMFPDNQIYEVLKDIEKVYLIISYEL